MRPCWFAGVVGFTMLIRPGAGAERDPVPTQHAPFGSLLQREASATSTLDRFPAFTTTGDIDGDGRPEVLVGSYTESVVTVHRLSGGRVGVPAPIDTGFGPTATPLLVDLDGDGDLDLLVTSRYRFDRPSEAATIGALANDGRGRFTSLWSRPARCVQADFHVGADGQRSILFADEDRRLVQLRLDGEAMPIGITVIDETGTDFAVSIDANGDGLDDVVYGPAWSVGSILLRLASPDGGWGDAGPQSGVGLGGSPMTKADVDEDGDIDLLIPAGDNDGPFTVSFSRPSGDGFITTPGLPRESRGFVSQAVIGDLDGDGVGEIAVSLAENSADVPSVIDVHARSGDNFPRVISVGQTRYPAIAIADLDADGIDDLLMLGREPELAPVRGTVSVLTGTRGRMPGSMRVIGANTAGLSQQPMLALDVDGDGQPVLLRREGSQLRLERWDAAGDRLVTLAIRESAIGVRRLIPGGRPGRVLVSSTGANAGVRVAVLDATETSFTVESAPLIEESVASIGEGDFDGDGDLDLVWTSTGVSAIRLALREGDRLIEQERVLSAFGVGVLLVADLDVDGRADVVIRDFAEGISTPRIRVMWGAIRGGLGPVSEPVLLAAEGVALDVPKAVLTRWPGADRFGVLVGGSGLDGITLVQLAEDDRTIVGRAVEPTMEGIDFGSTTATVGDLGDAGGLDVILVRCQGADLLVGRPVGPSDRPQLEIARLPLRTRWCDEPEIGMPAAIGDFDGDGRGDLLLGLGRSIGAVLLFARDAPTSCLGDLDANGSVDFSDLLLMLAPLPPEVLTPAAFQDLDGDFDRDAEDLLVLLDNWGECSGD